MNYENRVVLFLDILGFQKIIEKTEDNDKEVEKNTDSLLETLKQMKADVSRINENSSKVITQFSDSIVLSFREDDQREIFDFFPTIHRLIIRLLNRNILCRGAISYGKLYHNSDFIFGPALVDAYLTESTAALYPRVVLDSSVIQILKDQYSNNSLHKFRAIRFDSNIDGVLKIDSDEKLYFDYFSTGGIHFRDKDLTSYYSTLRTIIVNGLRNKNPSLLVKYTWMKNKYNKLKEELENIILINELDRDDLIEFAKKFKPIA